MLTAATAALTTLAENLDLLGCLALPVSIQARAGRGRDFSVSTAAAPLLLLGCAAALLRMMSLLFL
jgi:hypothetical protein